MSVSDKSVIIIMLHLSWCISYGQNLELMPGKERFFLDAQFLKFFDVENKFSLFSRARATAEYNRQNTDLFTGAYINYTTKSGFGGSIIGRISSGNAGIDAGIHYFKASKYFMIYALPSININDELLYSWFSILRFTPPFKNHWKLYTSLELFSAFGRIRHLSSVQRIRLGAGKNEYHFGVALNLKESSVSNPDVNPGVFFSKHF